jgi:hypothetical protein
LCAFFAPRLAFFFIVQQQGVHCAELFGELFFDHFAFLLGQRKLNSAAL